MLAMTGELQLQIYVATCFKSNSNYGHPEVYQAYSKQIKTGKARKWVWCMCGCVRKMGVPGSECGKVLIFNSHFQFLYMQPYFQTSHSKNDESVCYANVATTIHIN